MSKELPEKAEEDEVIERESEEIETTDEPIITSPSVDFEKLKAKSKRYYEEFFNPAPFLTLIGSGIFAHREFAFELFKPLGKRFKIIRNASYPTVKEFIRNTVRLTPRKLYFGAEYCEPLSYDHRVQDAKWKSSHLKFDIDLDHYDLIREYTCKCVGKQLCNNCFDIAKETAEFIITTLDEDFDILKKEARVFFSGTRGLHIHYPNYGILSKNITDVADTSTEIELRQAILKYFEIVQEKNKQLTRIVADIPNPNLRVRVQKMVIPKLFAFAPVDFLLNLEWNGVAKGEKKTRRKKDDLKKELEIIKKHMRESIANREVTIFNKERATGYNLYYPNVENNAILYRYPRFDGSPTVDIKKVIKVPMSVDFNSGYLVQEIKINDLYTIKLGDLQTIDHFL